MSWNPDEIPVKERRWANPEIGVEFIRIVPISGRHLHHGLHMNYHDGNGLYNQGFRYFTSSRYIKHPMRPVPAYTLCGAGCTRIVMM